MSAQPATSAGDESGLFITEEHQLRTALFTMAGEIDVATGTQLRARLAAGLNDPGAGPGDS